MNVKYTLAKQLAFRLPLTHPPEPRKEQLVSMPTEGVYIGKTKFLNVPVFWNPEKLINPHIAIIGITGSGKSYTVKTFLTRSALIWNSNAVVLDWVGEYREWVRQAGGKIIDLAKEKLNILDLVGLPTHTRIKHILSSFDVLVDLKNYPDERADIEEVLEEIYKKKKKATLIDVIKVLEKKDKRRAARLLKTFTTEGTDFFSGETTFNVSSLINSGLVCIDLHNLPTEEIRSLAGLTILQYIKELMRMQSFEEKSKKIKLFVVLDEAWKIASDEKSDVIAIVREGRKYNFSLIIATQNPTDMNKIIFSNVGTLFVLRLVLKEYRDYVKESVGYSNFIDQEIARFGVGNAAVNMIFAEKQTRTNTFLLEKIDGEEPLLLYKIKGGEMEIEIEREQFVRMLYEMGLNEEQVSIIKEAFEKNDGILKGEDLVMLMEKFGFSRSAIMSFFRQMGVDEKNLIKIFSLVKMKKAAKGMVHLVVE